MDANDMPVQAVNRFEVNAVLAADPLPGYPEFDGEPLTLARLEDRDAWGNNGRRRKARRIWDRFVAEVNEITARRNERLFKLLMVRGVPLDVPPMAEWSDLVEIDIDDGNLSPWMVKLLYIHHLLPGPDQKLALLTRIMEASGLETSTLRTVQTLFREALAAVHIEGE